MNFYIVDVLIQFPFPHADDTGLFRRTMPQSIAITFTVISKAAKIKWIRIITSANHRGIILIILTLSHIVSPFSGTLSRAVALHSHSYLVEEQST